MLVQRALLVVSLVCAATALSCLKSNPEFNPAGTGSEGGTAVVSASGRDTMTSGDASASSESESTSVDDTAGPTGTTSSVMTTQAPGTTAGQSTEGTEGTDTAGTSGGDGPTLCGFGAGEWSLTPPEPLLELNTDVSEGEPYMRPDGLTLFFSSSRPGGLGSFDSYRATRTSVDAPFGAVINNEDLGLNSVALDSKATLTEDGLRAYQSSGRDGGAGETDLWSATRATDADPFSGFQNLAALNTADAEYDPHLSQDRLRIYFARRGVNAHDLYVSERQAPEDPFPAPSPIAELNSAQIDSHPALSDDELTIIFESDRLGSLGSSDLWVATRDAIDAPFGAPKLVPVVNSASFDGEPLIVEQTCELVLASDRPGGLGQWDLYRATFIAGP